MKQPVFTGAAVAIITPMHADGTVNFEELGRIIDDQIAHGTDAIVICGTTGESAALSHGACGVHPFCCEAYRKARSCYCGHGLQRYGLCH